MQAIYSRFIFNLRFETVSVRPLHVISNKEALKKGFEP